MNKELVKKTAPALNSHVGMRIDKWLSALMPQFSRARLQSLIKTGNVIVNGLTVSEPAAKIKYGDTAELRVPKPISAKPKPENIPLDIIFEDSSIIVVNKPAGLVIHPAAGNLKGTLVNALIGHCGSSLSGIGGVKRPGIVHRLDKDTSGLIVAAKNDYAHKKLVSAFKEKSIHRTYLALVWGSPSPKKGTITGNIGRSIKNRKKMSVVARGGKVAITNYTTIRTWEKEITLIQCQLDTGRTHQIRVHLANKGHPILGDQTYGSSSISKLLKLSDDMQTLIKGLKRQFLHAVALEFPHPLTGDIISLNSPLPVELQEILTK